MNGPIYQSYENAKKLNNICVGHRVEAACQCVQGGDECRDNDGGLHVDVNDHADGGSWKKVNRTLWSVYSNGLGSHARV